MRLNWSTSRPSRRPTSVDIERASAARISSPRSSRASFVVAPLAVPLDQPHGGVLLVTDLEVEAHPRPGAGLVDHRGDDTLVVVPGHAAVEGERDGVDDRRLARARGTDQRHELDVGEVDGARITKRAEALQLQPHRPHGARRLGVEQLGEQLASEPGVVDALRRQVLGEQLLRAAAVVVGRRVGRRARASGHRCARRRHPAPATVGRRRPARPGVARARRRAATDHRRWRSRRARPACR